MSSIPQIRPRLPLAGRCALVCAALVACAGDDQGGSESDAATMTTMTTGASATATSTATATATSSAATSSAATDGTGDTATSSESESATSGTTGVVVDVPGGVFLWTGAGGGGPGSDLYVDDVVAVLSDAGVDVAVGEALPGGFAEAYGTLVYMNPTGDFPADVDAAAAALVAAGGRVVLVMEHCKNGCWGNADGHNALLMALGAGMRLSGDGGAPLSQTTLEITADPPLTDGVGALVTFYSGHVLPGPATIPVGAIKGGDLVVAAEPAGLGEVVAIADSSMLGYVLDAGDNARLVANFGAH